MSTTLEAANDAMRAAVKNRLDATPKDDPKIVGYVSQPATEPRDIDASTEELQHVTLGYDAELLKEAQDFLDVLNEFKRWNGDGLTQSDVHPTSQAFFDLCDALKEMHRRKSSDYGCPSGTDPLANIRNGAKFVGIPAWKGAMVRLSDKVTRLAAYNATGRLENESLEDNLFDLASYSLLALLLHREERDA
jgi:hypothetical protein